MSTNEKLTGLIQLPDVRALKWEVTHHDRGRLAPGYWFVAPYGQINPEQHTQKYQQYQVGPHIYDNDGMLIWAGSKFHDNRNVFDFRANQNMDGDIHLSFVVAWDLDNEFQDRGRGVIMDQHYQVMKDVLPFPETHDFNMHEFNILDGGKTVVACVYGALPVKLEEFGRPEEESWIVTGGFVEYDIATNEVLMRWEGLDHIAMHESNKFLPTNAPATGPPGWDYVHANAVDKNPAGDYIISMRFTNTIYGVGRDGRILWRLGGQTSDFDQDFTFSKQHDAKFISSKDNIHVISLLNNASDEDSNDEDVSSVLHVELDTLAMTARVIKRVNRPDGKLTRLRGNTHTLPNENIFVGWSEYGYQSEHAANGDVLMTARFASDRFSTYRAYKSEFVGRPLTPPDVVASVHGASDTTLSTVIYVSWNGATDIATWNFYAQANSYGESVLIGSTNKTDFETSYTVDGYMDYIIAEAVDRNGNFMGRSSVHRSEIPNNWQAAGFRGSTNPSAQDPKLVLAIQQDSKETPSKEGDISFIKSTGGLLIGALMLCTLLGGLVAGYYMMKSRKTRSYRGVPSEENEEYLRLQGTRRLSSVPE
ncbi:hypothetical protein PEX2_075120 [Penicillium expansum]|uniref:Arylsulfotransferase n=1 Tax=Penicillium expansum TaxID=27334 RepID=A0A0A2JVN8_PENEN|nr:hypothetical protein PEX2_075120 [Penicillium expansum]KGO40830.1 hypothetical protein PEXP_086420 [Penicillium expansum]KGO59532.1 hypothetical protein PEX2_075120 [Penicillium expansum]